jgi:hypothetical protein
MARTETNEDVALGEGGGELVVALQVSFIEHLDRVFIPARAVAGEHDLKSGKPQRGEGHIQEIPHPEIRTECKDTGGESMEGNELSGMRHKWIECTHGGVGALAEDVPEIEILGGHARWGGRGAICSRAWRASAAIPRAAHAARGTCPRGRCAQRCLLLLVIGGVDELAPDVDGRRRSARAWRCRADGARRASRPGGDADGCRTAVGGWWWEVGERGGGRGG